MRHRRHWTLLAVRVCLAVALAAGSVGGQLRKPDPDSLAGRISTILESKEAQRAHWGIQVVSLDTGKTIYAKHDHQFFTPASNTKLFTAAAALMGLGPDFKFRTTVESAAMPDKLGRIAGDVILVGRGDPNLSGRQLPYQGRTERTAGPLRALDLLADQVAERGVRYVDGDVVADDTYFVFERYAEGWSQDDLLWYYGAPVSALSVNDNTLFLEVLPGEKPGDPALVKLDPFEGYYRVENRIVTVDRRAPQRAAGGGDEEGGSRKIQVNREPGSLTLELWGRIPVDDAGAHEMLAIEDPAQFAARYFRDALQRRGVVVYGQPRVMHLRPIDLQVTAEALPSAASRPRALLATVESLPLVEDLKVISKVSQNLHAEMVLRTLSQERRADIGRYPPGSTAAGLAAMKTFLTRAGVPEDEYTFADGSGLSRQNLVTPAAVVRLLTYMDKSAHRERWLDLLPIAGVDGTIADRFKDTPATGKIRAKTGSLGHVNALSGYATTASGERLAFSIFVNNHNLRGGRSTVLVDSIASALVNR